MENALAKLIKVVSDLRNPKTGCPWDLKQTTKSLIPYVIEEAHEVADAIREGNDENLIEELGDLLLQVILHAQIAKEENRFCLEDIIDKITLKMIRRHPHVFNGKKINSIADVNNIWETIKASEKSLPKSYSPLSDSLMQKIKSQSAIYGATMISSKMSKIGFKLYRKNEVWKILSQEIEALKNAINYKDKCYGNEELGQVLFTLINLANWNSLNPEESLISSNKQFISRFSFIEKENNGHIGNQSINYFKEAWEKTRNLIHENK